jgi:hypothetical protein
MARAKDKAGLRVFAGLAMSEAKKQQKGDAKLSAQFGALR